jgi:hypothetical protein
MRRSTRGYKAGNGGGGGGGAAVCVLLLGWPFILAGQQVEAGRARAERWEEVWRKSKKVGKGRKDGA